eukprot:scaffold27914_cov35-Cyclotella_meneghiniana.AAC.1
MSKPRAAKRAKSYKSPESDDDDETTVNNRLVNLDLGEKSNTPKVIANALLSLLPSNATKQHASAKKLTKAFQLVTAELEARSNKAARQQIEVGASQPIKFSFVEEDSGEITSTIEVPEDSFVNILRYLDGRELAKASCVCKVWLSVTRLPIVWEDGLDMSSLNYNKVLNMTGLLKLLQRPQFANVKAFAFPKKVKIGDNTMKQLAKALPHLEALDLSDSKAKDQHVMAAIENFPSLNALRIDTWFSLTSSGITSAVQMMGEQLLDLRIDAILSYVSQSTMEAIVTHCPNLEYFAYRNNGYSYYPNSDDVTGESVVALVRACRRLHTVELYKTYVHSGGLGKS